MGSKPFILVVVVAVLIFVVVSTFSSREHIRIESPSLVDVPEGGEVLCPLTFISQSSAPIRIVGSNASCACASVPEFPLDIQSKSIVEANIKISARGKNVGEKSRLGILFFGFDGDTKFQKSIVVDFEVKSAIPIN